MFEVIECDCVFLMCSFVVYFVFIVKVVFCISGEYWGDDVVFFVVVFYSCGVDNGVVVIIISSYYFWKCERNMFVWGDGNNGIEMID